MKRDRLPPPRLVCPDAGQPLPPWMPARPGTVPAPVEPEPAPSVDSSTVTARPLERGRLPEPSQASGRRRHLFDPRSGWFRHLERQASLWLSRHCFPRIPWMHVPYDWVLRQRLSLSEADVALPGLPAAFEGFRLLLLSDLHAGPFVSGRALAESVERLLATEPDAVVLAGDLTTSQLSEFAGLEQTLGLLSAPAGVFAVLGNHDHYTDDPERVRELLEAAGVQVLHNRSVRLRRGAATLDLAGVDDLLRGAPDLDAAIRDTRPPVVLISHNPDLFLDAARRRVALTLSGHTHGGQVRLRGLPVLVRQSRFRLDEGRYRLGESELIVSRGLGVVGLPVRFGCAPEGILLRLRGAATSTDTVAGPDPR